MLIEPRRLEIGTPLEFHRDLLVLVVRTRPSSPHSLANELSGCLSSSLNPKFNFVTIHLLELGESTLTLPSRDTACPQEIPGLVESLRGFLGDTVLPPLPLSQWRLYSKDQIHTNPIIEIIPWRVS